MECLVIREEGKSKTFGIESRVVTIGRSTKNNIVLKDRNSSRQHCNIFKVGESWFVVDCESHNGTFINGERVNKKELADGDKISIGAVDIVFSLKGEKLPEEPAPSENPEIAASGTVAKSERIDKTGEISSGQVEVEEIAEEVSDEIAEEVEESTQKADRVETAKESLELQDLSPTKKVPAEVLAKMAAMLPQEQDGEFGARKEEGVKKDLEKLRDIYQKFNGRLAWQTIGQEKFAKRFWIALLTGGHCLLRGETSAVSALLPKISRTLGLSYQYFWGGDQSRKIPQDCHLSFLQNTPAAQVLPVMLERHNAPSREEIVPWMLILVEPPEDKGLDTLLQHAFLFTISLPPFKIEQEIAFLQLAASVAAPEKSVASVQDLLSFRLLLDEIQVPSPAIEYVARLMSATRPKSEGAPKIVQEKLVQGVGPASGVWIIKAARASAALHGRQAVTAKDVQSVAQYLIPYRLQLSAAAQKIGESPKTVYNSILNQVKQPVEPEAAEGEQE